MTYYNWSNSADNTVILMRSIGASRREIAAALGIERGAVSGRIFRLQLPLIVPANSQRVKRPRGGKYGY